MFTFPKNNLFSICYSSRKNVQVEKEEKNFMEDGTDIKWEDTVEFTFPVKGGRVIKVYDADTITIVSKLPYDDSPMYRLSVILIHLK